MEYAGTKYTACREMLVRKISPQSKQPVEYAALRIQFLQCCLSGLTSLCHLYSREQRAKCLLAGIWRLPRGSNTPLLAAGYLIFS